MAQQGARRVEGARAHGIGSVDPRAVDGLDFANPDAIGANPRGAHRQERLDHTDIPCRANLAWGAQTQLRHAESARWSKVGESDVFFFPTVGESDVSSIYIYYHRPPV